MDLTLREASALLSIVCIAGILFRGIAYWREMTVLEDILTVTIAAMLMTSAIASLALDRVDAPSSGVLPYAFVIKLGLLVVLGYWPVLVGRLGPPPPWADPEATERSDDVDVT